MQSLSDLFANNKLLAVGILLALVVAVAVVVVVVYRLLFGRRLSQTGAGRSRQPRLGVVDAFDLDRQRQLVIVRRDNIEHLVMIGGPNDVVIETAIVRSMSSGTQPAARDKDAGPAGIVIPTVLPSLPAQTSSAPTSQGTGPAALSGAAPTVPPATPPRPEEGGRASSSTATPLRGKPEGGEPQSSPRPTPIAPPVLRSPPPRQPSAALPAATGGSQPRAAMPLSGAAPRAPFPLPPRSPAAPPRPADSPQPVSVPPGELKSPDTEPRPEGAAPVQDAPAPSPQINPGAEVKPPAKESMPPSSRQRPEPTKVEATAGRSVPAPVLPGRSPLPPARSGASPPVRALDALESLEEEMAKLLGRPVPPADKT